MASLHYNTAAGTTASHVRDLKAADANVFTGPPRCFGDSDYCDYVRRLEAAAAVEVFLEFVWSVIAACAWAWLVRVRQLCGRRPFWWLGAPPLGPPALVVLVRGRVPVGGRREVRGMVDAVVTPMETLSLHGHEQGADVKRGTKQRKARAAFENSIVTAMDNLERRTPGIGEQLAHDIRRHVWFGSILLADTAECCAGLGWLDGGRIRDDVSKFMRSYEFGEKLRDRRWERRQQYQRDERACRLI